MPKNKSNQSKTFQMPKYFIDDDGRFVIEQYNHAKTFTNFFPGIAGLWGIPMWVFYVNRGQCITSFGTESKDKAIMEFHPANKAYRLTSLQGFRTFLKIKDKQKTSFYEPFRNGFGQVTQSMAINSHDLTIEEINQELGLLIRVNYFTISDEPFAALVRQVTIKNVSRKAHSFEILDGMPVIVPFGFNEWTLKHMSRTAEAWVQVTNLEKKAPYFNLKVAIADKPQVDHITEGNFYVSFLDAGQRARLLDVIIDPEAVFGHSSDFINPEIFFTTGNFKASQSQKASNKTPCAMSFAKFNLPAGAEKSIVSLAGHIHSVKELNSLIVSQMSGAFIRRKSDENKNNIERIKNTVLTVSSSETFNLYCGQTFLDNVVRGGLPVSLETKEGKVAFNVFTRKHGDPERDYNHFLLSPTFLSQGNGNFRDVNQNRRNDVWFNRDVKDSAIVNFLSLIQADGYNPLIIEGMTFSVDDQEQLDSVLRICFEEKDREKVKSLLTDWFQPGELLKAILEKDIKIKVSAPEFLSQLLCHCHKHESAKHGEGFWTDHWAYNLDLIESFLAVYPEEKERLLFKKKEFGFYHNTHYVLPRDQRYFLTPKGCRQYHSVAKGIKESKIEHDHKLRIHNGRGPVYHTTLLTKLLCVIANKVATFDPSGIGIEMEADKPNWYDALNGLPGLLGSSISETFELKRLCLFLLDSLTGDATQKNGEIRIFEELHTFILSLTELLSTDIHKKNASGNYRRMDGSTDYSNFYREVSNGSDALFYWMRANEIKEHYRSRIRNGIDGLEKGLTIADIKKFLKQVVVKTQKATSLAQEKEGLATYFIHEIIEYEKLDKHNQEGLPFVWPLKFKRRALPLFLEGFVHALRVAGDKKSAVEIYESVKKSPLFDRKLKMYRVNADLTKETEEIGRARIFPQGWLENQSIWLHMEYKFLLELLRSGLYDEFYENFKSALIPFLPPQMYGRSILENSSFIVSSAHEESNLHGRGFVARLSGTTAEFVHMWLMMSAGQNPFRIDVSGKLNLQFEPILPGWLFTKNETQTSFHNIHGTWQGVTLSKNTYAFNFMGATLVVYHNPKRLDTFGDKKAAIAKIILHYYGSKSPVTISSETIPSPHADDVRSGKVERIDIILK